jgi:hypothetical protein
VSTLVEAVIGRPDGVGVVDAYERWLQAFLLGDAALRAIDHPGGMPRLVAANDGLRRGLLDLTHLASTALGDRLHETEAMPIPVAYALSDALLAVTVRTIEAIGALTDPSQLPSITSDVADAIAALRPLSTARSSIVKRQV